MAIAKKTAEPGGVISLPKLARKSISIDIEGITPYIPHAWSEKARAMMPGHPDKPQVTAKRGAHNPEEEAEACVYRLPDGRYGIPANCVKAAIVGACRLFDKGSVTMVSAKIMVWVHGYGPESLIPFEFDQKILREDTPRNANGGCDLRYRYMFTNWKATIEVGYLSQSIDHASILSLVSAAGLGGIGDWRPSAPKSNCGTFGTFDIPSSYEGAPNA